MTTVERLLDAAKEIWDSYYAHPFVKGIEDGTLDREKFRYYIIQDYLYLEDYAKPFAIGIVKAKSNAARKIFSGYITLLTGNEMDIHHGYMGRFGVAQEEVDNTPRALDNLSYTSYMLRVAYEEGEAEILAAVLSCAYSYELIAKNMVKNTPRLRKSRILRRMDLRLCIRSVWKRKYRIDGHAQQADRELHRAAAEASYRYFRCMLPI